MTLRIAEQCFMSDYVHKLRAAIVIVIGLFLYLLATWPPLPDGLIVLMGVGLLGAIVKWLSVEFEYRATRSRHATSQGRRKSDGFYYVITLIAAILGILTFMKECS